MFKQIFTDLIVALEGADHQTGMTVAIGQFDVGAVLD